MVSYAALSTIIGLTSEETRIGRHCGKEKIKEDHACDCIFLKEHCFLALRSRLPFVASNHNSSMT